MVVVGREEHQTIPAAAAGTELSLDNNGWLEKGFLEEELKVCDAAARI